MRGEVDVEKWDNKNYPPQAAPPAMSVEPEDEGDVRTMGGGQQSRCRESGSQFRSFAEGSHANGGLPEEQSKCVGVFWSYTTNTGSSEPSDHF